MLYTCSLTDTNNNWTFVVDVFHADITDNGGIDRLDPGVQLGQGKTTAVAQHLSETQQSLPLVTLQCGQC